MYGKYIKTQRVFFKHMRLELSDTKIREIPRLK